MPASTVMTNNARKTVRTSAAFAILKLSLYAIHRGQYVSFLFPECMVFQCQLTDCSTIKLQDLIIPTSLEWNSIGNQT